MTPIPAVQTQALGKRYGSHWALRECSLTIPTGSVTALVGPNGAGKTTLLHLAIGLTEPTAGEVRVLGWAPRAAAARASSGRVRRAGTSALSGFQAERDAPAGRRAESALGR